MPVYLFASLCLTACLAAGCLLCPRQRGPALLAGVVLAPFALLGAVFVPAYWQPDHVVTFVRGVGPEDVLFCVACGGLGWLAAAGGSAPHWTGRPAVGPFAARFGSWAAGSLGAVTLAVALGCDILPAVVLGFAAVGAAIVGSNPHLLRLAVRGMLGFTAVYAAVGWLVIAAHPTATRFWAGDAVCGRRALGLPVEELVWAACFGGTWPVAFAYCLGSERHRGEPEDVR